MRSGKVVKKPVVGDIVAFYYRGSKSSFHVGIYVGGGKMIHAYRPGVVTRIESVARVAKDNWAKYKFVRILPQPEAIVATAAGS
jgi:cell wall-associated NlpC family hydrolase